MTNFGRVLLKKIAVVASPYALVASPYALKMRRGPHLDRERLATTCVIKHNAPETAFGRIHKNASRYEATLD